SRTEIAREERNAVARHDDDPGKHRERRERERGGAAPPQPRLRWRKPSSQPDRRSVRKEQCARRGGERRDGERERRSERNEREERGPEGGPRSRFRHPTRLDRRRDEAGEPRSRGGAETSKERTGHSLAHRAGRRLREIGRAH